MTWYPIARGCSMLGFLGVALCQIVIRLMLDGDDGLDAGSS
jgi:hypothetical protein